MQRFFCLVGTMSGLLAVLIVLVLASGFFSASETSIMTLNPYRLRHWARKGHHKAKRILSLLRRPDRLLGVVLIGNTCANIFASSVMTLIASHYFNGFGIVMATVLLTFVIMIFSEIAPKTLAALHPQGVAFACSLPLRWLLVILYPIVFISNTMSNGLLRLFSVQVKARVPEQLTTEELCILVREASGKIPALHQKMLLRILELGGACVSDIMVPRHAISGLDLNMTWKKISHHITQTSHSFLPVYQGDINHISGILHTHSAVAALHNGNLCAQTLTQFLEEVYYVPETTNLNDQLLHFQQEHRSIALVVDEYGDIQGLITVQDILEEIVGRFAGDATGIQRMIQLQEDGSYLVNGSINIRDLNRLQGWNLPVDGPRTLSGLIIETLECIPNHPVCLRMGEHLVLEVHQVSHNKIQIVRVFIRETLHALSSNQ